SRLYLSDYHHFHFADSGIPGEAVSIPGKYYAVSPYARRALVPFYTENHRMVTTFDSDHFGRMILVEIGAFTVGSIQQHYQPGMRVAKGARKGVFELGGSTVVLLFPPGAITFDGDLLAHTKDEIETYVQLGDSIGRTPG
ncbi:MAG: phosphatidylserine decarboxylase, partial [Candidatus Krumholzibacteria bacterium]|nr:phosphatidylserine decarboxylase [Candidatus Krumholzibacteria bacterium]